MPQKAQVWPLKPPESSRPVETFVMGIALTVVDEAYARCRQPPMSWVRLTPHVVRPLTPLRTAAYSFASTQ